MVTSFSARPRQLCWSLSAHCVSSLTPIPDLYYVHTQTTCAILPQLSFRYACGSMLKYEIKLPRSSVDPTWSVRLSTASVNISHRGMALQVLTSQGSGQGECHPRHLQ